MNLAVLATVKSHDSTIEPSSSLFPQLFVVVSLDTSLVRLVWVVSSRRVAPILVQAFFNKPANVDSVTCVWFGNDSTGRMSQSDLDWSESLDDVRVASFLMTYSGLTRWRLPAASDDFKITFSFGLNRRSTRFGNETRYTAYVLGSLLMPHFVKTIRIMSSLDKLASVFTRIWTRLLPILTTNRLLLILGGLLLLEM